MMAGRAILVVVALACAWSGAAKELQLDITVPPFEVSKEDSYVCTTVPLPAQPYKLVGVQPLAEQQVVHHILLFGCATPHVTPKNGKPAVWDCTGVPTCSGGETVIYGWGRNAGKLELPAGVGFSVGGSTSIKYIVAQVHYLQKRPKGDKSGVKLTLQAEPVPLSAGLLSYASWFTIPPGRKHHLVQNQCCYRGFQPVTTFAVRVHTHHMGKEVVMTRRSQNSTGLQRLARGDPQAPQGFYPLQSQKIWPGDRLLVTCDFDSSGMVHEVAAGPTHEHEMCNMYVMVYSEIPYMEMCSDGTMLVGEDAPGNMPRTGAFYPDPYPLWKPPLPDSTPKEGKGVLGDVASSAVGADGSLWALHRGGRVWGADAFDGANRITHKEPIVSDVVVQMDADTGTVLRRWGAGIFWMPHMISIDRDGNVWVTDVGRHQALKFSIDGELLMEVGKKLAPGGDRFSLCKPTQVAFLSDGGFVVSDGYCNSRVMRYNRDGSFHSVYTKPSSLGAPMAIVHSVLVEECDGLLLAADREGSMVVTWRLKEHDVSDLLDLRQHGRVWALVAGPYGKRLALTWEQEGKPARLVDLATRGKAFWELPGLENRYPHDVALGAAPLALTGAGDRLFAAYVAPLCAGCGPLQRFVLFPPAFIAPREAKASDGQAQLQQAAQASGGAAFVQPLAHGVGSFGHVHPAGAGGSSDGSAGAAGDDADDDDKPQMLLPKGEIQRSGCECVGQANCSCAAAAEQELLEKLTEVQAKLAALQAARGVGAGSEVSETFIAPAAAAKGSVFGSVVQVGLVALVLGAFIGTLAFWGLSRVMEAGATARGQVRDEDSSSGRAGSRGSSDGGAYREDGLFNGDLREKESDALLSAGIPSRHYV